MCCLAAAQWWLHTRTVRAGTPACPDKRMSAAPSTHTHPHPHRWHWGAIVRDVAEAKLKGRPEGTFLVRNSQPAANTNTISVVLGGQVTHVRVKKINGMFATDKTDTPCATLAELINQKTTKNGSAKPSKSRPLKVPLAKPARQRVRRTASAMSTASNISCSSPFGIEKGFLLHAETTFPPPHQLGLQAATSTAPPSLTATQMLPLPELAGNVRAAACMLRFVHGALSCAQTGCAA